MATGWGATAGNAALTAQAAAYPWVKLHTGSPGAAGTSNAAAETTRKQATWGTAAGGTIANTNALQWTSVAGAETYTHFTTWSDVSAGSFGFSGTISASGAVAIGDNFTVAIGALTATLVLAS